MTREVELKKRISHLEEYLRTHAQDAESWYDLAGCFDSLGEELKAEPCYAKVEEIGFFNLSAESQKGFHVGYGSTLRNNGKFSESKEILLRGVSLYPEMNSLKFFLALTLHESGEFREANLALFDLARNLPPDAVEGYDRAIRFYVENLNAN